MRPIRRYFSVLQQTGQASGGDDHRAGRGRRARYQAMDHHVVEEAIVHRRP
jgi:hypothetical protein